MGPIIVKLEPNTEHLLCLPASTGTQMITFSTGELEVLYQVLHKELRPGVPVSPADKPLGSEGLIDRGIAVEG